MGCTTVYARARAEFTDMWMDAWVCHASPLMSIVTQQPHGHSHCSQTDGVHSDLCTRMDIKLGAAAVSLLTSLGLPEHLCGKAQPSHRLTL